MKNKIARTSACDFLGTVFGQNYVENREKYLMIHFLQLLYLVIKLYRYSMLNLRIEIRLIHDKQL